LYVEVLKKFYNAVGRTFCDAILSYRSSDLELPASRHRED